MLKVLLLSAVLLQAALAFHDGRQRITAPTASCPECGLTPSQLIEFWGYPVEEHIITCDDGFPIRLLRIPYGVSAKAKAIPHSTVRPAVLLQHGLLDASTTWIMNLPHQSLGFILADEGFDVWIGNSRGNTWSPPSCDTEECWQFTFDDMAAYDLPANIDYILKRTGLPSIGYVGHSQGTIQAFAAFSDSDELQKKVNVFAALAPVTYVYHQQSKLVSYLAALDVDQILQDFGLKQFLPSSSLIRFLGGVSFHS
jgi:lysosomal acid lipase/cholesteryl ester hydrolase